MLFPFIILVAHRAFVMGEQSDTTLDPLAIKIFNNSVNVKTVLFKEADSCRLCWSKHDLNLLIARRLVQDLIPRKIPKDFPALLKYLLSIIEGLKAKCSEKNIKIMLTAVYDALGGYLHAVVIPVLNEAYYAGNVDYQTTSQFHHMLGLMMEFLGTNGNGWSPPCDMGKIPTKVAPLPIKLCKVDEACDSFVIRPNETAKMDKNQDFCPNNQVATGDSLIQIPFLDDNTYPSAIAVPLKDHPLFSLMSECSVNIVPKYYILAMRCLSTPRFSNKDILIFNKQLHRWVITTVIPHLHETSRWYPGFGSIMRVVETMNQRGLASNEAIKVDIQPNNKIRCMEMPLDESCNGASNIWIYIIIGVIIFIVLFIICCLLHCCITIARRRKAGIDECSEKAANPFVNLYCGLHKKGGQSKPKSSSSSYDSTTEATEDEGEE